MDDGWMDGWMVGEWMNGCMYWGNHQALIWEKINS